MGEARARVEQGVNAAEGEVRAVAEVDALEDAGGDGAAVADLLRLCERYYAAVRDVATFHQADSLQFREGCQLCDRVVCEVGAACQVDVADAVAQLDKLDYTRVGDARAVPQMNVV